MEELVSACKVFSWDIAMSYASFPLLISLSLSQLCLSLSEFGFIQLSVMPLSDSLPLLLKPGFPSLICLTSLHDSTAHLSCQLMHSNQILDSQ